jgi:hypothetical protein
MPGLPMPSPRYVCCVDLCSMVTGCAGKDTTSPLLLPNRPCLCIAHCRYYMSLPLYAVQHHQSCSASPFVRLVCHLNHTHSSAPLTASLQGLDTREKGAPDERTLVLDVVLCDALFKGVGGTLSSMTPWHIVTTVHLEADTLASQGCKSLWLRDLHHPAVSRRINSSALGTRASITKHGVLPFVITQVVKKGETFPSHIAKAELRERMVARCSAQVHRDPEGLGGLLFSSYQDNMATTRKPQTCSAWNPCEHSLSIGQLFAVTHAAHSPLEPAHACKVHLMSSSEQ